MKKNNMNQSKVDVAMMVNIIFFIHIQMVLFIKFKRYVIILMNSVTLKFDVQLLNQCNSIKLFYMRIVLQTPRGLSISNTNMLYG